MITSHKVEIPELSVLHTLIRKAEGYTKGAGQMAISRNMDRFLEALLKGRHQCPVFGGGALKLDSMTDLGFRGHFGQIVFPDAVQHGGQHFIHRISLAQIVVKITFHEHGTTIAGQGRALVLGAYAEIV